MSSGAVSKIDKIWNDFYKERTENLFDRFNGWYRAEVVETNDPLRLHRVRFKLPELHNDDLKAEECQWANPDPAMGGKRAGFWASLCIGDWVWINFEKGHPYGPIWSGAADPTRRKMYALEQIFGKTQIALNEKGEPAEAPDDYDEEYMPKDERPMSTGFKDRYGNLIYMGAVGFFPKEHKEKPAPTGADPVTKGEFKASKKPPEKNKPDFKLMAMLSKYGNCMVVADMGYDWEAEFKGDFEEDEDFEIKRWKYWQKQLAEGDPKEVDQRRIEIRSRFGHKFEIRDVGWKKSRPEEYDKQVDLTQVEGKNEKEQVWIKLATKDGSYFRMWSKGADLEKNLFVKRLNKSDVGTKPYDEDQFGDGQKDCRGFWLCSPGQVELALDDAGADPVDPQNKENHGNGWRMAARRDGRYFAIEANIKDALQRILMHSSNGAGFELNQLWDYLCMTTKPPKTISEKWSGPYKEIGWALQTYKGLNVEKYCFHLMLDFLNKYIRLKTPKGQGVEMRDGGGKDPCGGTWTEIRDADDRGMWFSKENNFGIWRDKKKKKYICINDDTDYIIIRNELKTVQIYAQKDVEVIAKGDIKMKAGGNFDVSAGGVVNIRGSDCKVGPNLKTMDFKCNLMCGTHTELKIPLHPNGDAGPCGSPPSPSTPSPMQCTILKPEDFDKERGCDPTKPKKGPVDRQVVHCGPGQGAGNNNPPSMNSDGDNPDVHDPSGGPPDIVTDPSAGPPPPAPPVVDPLDQFSSSASPGVLWFGTSTTFDDDISASGLKKLSLSNPLFDPDNPIDYLPLAITADIAIKKYAELGVQKYGGDVSIYRVVAVDDGNLLSVDPDDNEIVRYSGDSIKEMYTEKFE